LDLVQGCLIPFTNVTDKGYRCVAAAWRHGRQFLLQPQFAKSDKQFTTTHIISSAAIASDRGGNEHAVRVCKEAGVLKQGLYKAGSMETLCDMWLAWSFQANFMFGPVL